MDPFDLQPGGGAGLALSRDGAPGTQRVPQGAGQQPPGHRLGARRQGVRRALGHDPPAVQARPRAEVDDVPGLADGLLVVLDHHHGVAASRQVPQGIDQEPVVPGVQPDGGLVEHVADPAQVGAELGRQADALRLATGERRGRAVEGEVTEAHLLQEAEPPLQLGQGIPGDLRFPAREAQGAEVAVRRGQGHRRVFGDGLPLESDRQRDGVESAARAGGAGLLLTLEPVVPPHLLPGLLGVEPGEDRAGAVAALAPAVFRVEGEEPGIGLGKAAPAGGAGAPGGEEGIADPCEPFAVLEGGPQQPAQLPFAARLQHDLPHREIDVVLAEAVEPRPAAGRDHDAVDPELPVALSGGPAGEVRVVALAGDDQRRQHPGPLAPPLAQQLGHDGVRSPGLDGTAAIRAVLHSQAHEEEPQEVIGLGEGRHRALAPPAARALLDGHGRRDAEHRVDLGPARRLHELPGVGVERLQIPALAFREEDVEGQRALATSAHPRDHGEAVARDGDVDPLQVVLAGIEDLDRALAPSPREVRCAR